MVPLANPEFPVTQPEAPQNEEGDKEDEDEWGDFGEFQAPEETKKVEEPTPQTYSSIPSTNLLDLNPIQITNESQSQSHSNTDRNTDRSMPQDVLESQPSERIGSAEEDDF